MITKDEMDLFGEQYLCSVKLNNLKVPTKNIQNIVLREWIFDSICTLEMTIMDSGIYIEMSPLYDESPLEVAISKNDGSELINLDFVVNNYEYDRLNVDGGDLYAIHLVAVQKTNNFFYPQYSRYYDSCSSKEVVKRIAEENDNMKFESNVDADDTQHWYQIALTNFDMLKHIAKRSYIKQEDLPIIYMDRTKTLHYNSLRTSCKQPAKFNAYCDDILALDSGNDKASSDRIKRYKESNTIECLFYKTGFSTKNIASSNNKDMGYGIDMTYFDHQDFYRYVMNFKFAPLTKYANVNKNNYNHLTQSITYNTVHKNTHKNYLVANLQNQYIKSVFFNSYIQLIMAPNANLKLMDVINVVIPDVIKSKMTGKQEVDKVNSGLYLVAGIMHDLQKDGFYSMVVTLIRNGVNKSDYNDNDFAMLEVEK